MKLIAKYNRVNIPITIGILLISSIAYYFILHIVLLNQVDNDLQIEKQEIIHYVNEKGILQEASNYKDQQIEFTPTSLTHFETKLTNENIYNKIEDESEPFRRIDFLIKENGNYYIATINKSVQETEDIVRLILMITLLVIAVLLLILFITNRFVLSKLWKPFNNTLEQLKQFNLSAKNKILLQPTDVDEFKELNATTFLMIQKVSSDYESLKRFTENASHEIQTPLAIIKNKIELLLQSENLDGAQINVIQSLNDAASRLSRMNQSLLLLTKIENSQFDNTERINFSFILTRYIENLEELASAKDITIVKNIANDFFIDLNESLAEILISNVVVNAIKHNYPGGNIKIDLGANGLSVSNTGTAPKIKTSELFERFKKDSASGDSIGLGLSIVKTICDKYDFDVSYNFIEERHVVKIAFI
ncbi:MAG: HAMP domain-containing sensor histidine kinase [Ginsengibacter sp.]